MRYNTTVPEVRASHALTFLNCLHQASLIRARDRRVARQALISRIDECAENGQILVLESGIDCDGSQYSGRTSLIDSTVEAFDAHYDSVAQWADGVFYLSIERPSLEIEYQSRDLALEAFEDGHPYSLYV
jgi:hypothetical protein